MSPSPSPMTTWTPAQAESYLAGPRLRVWTPALYRTRLLVVAFSLVLLQATHMAIESTAPYDGVDPSQPRSRSPSRQGNRRVHGRRGQFQPAHRGQRDLPGEGRG